MKSRKVAHVKSVLILILSLPLILGETGYWLYANIYQHVLNAEISEVLHEISCDDDQLVPLRFPLVHNTISYFTWTKEGKEFLFAGEMYDIVRTITSSDSVTYLCFRDIQENSYRLKLENLASQEQGSSGGISVPVRALNFIYLPSLFLFHYAPHGAYTFPLIATSTVDPLLDTDSPPPRSYFR